jgi:hypothetical protein
MVKLGKPYWSAIVLWVCMLSVYHAGASPVLIPIELDFGWNFVSFPGLPTPNAPDAVFGGAKEGPVWRHNGGRYEPAGSLEAGKGYAVYAPADAVVIVAVDPNVRQGVRAEYGWNLVGAFSRTPVPGEATGGAWEHFFGRYFRRRNWLSPGDAYWLLFPEAGMPDLGQPEDDHNLNGLPDYWEILWGIDFPLRHSDGDTLDALAEFLAGTNPLTADSDGDGISDDDEVQLGSDPLDAHQRDDSHGRAHPRLLPRAGSARAQAGA